MGGVPVLAAAAAQPDGYKAMVLEGSTPGFLGAKAPRQARTTWPWCSASSTSSRR